MATIRPLDRATALRLGRTLSAQGYGQVVTIVVQLALVPVLLHAWGTRLYGSWLLLSAVPFYLTLSDFGFTFVAKNEMVMAVAARRCDAALRTFQSVFALLCVAVPVLLALSAAFVLAIDWGRLLGIEAAGARVALLLLVANVLLYPFFLLVCAGIRAANRPASEALWGASARLGEGVAVALAATSGGAMAAAGAAMVAVRLFFVVAGYGWLRRRSKWLRLGLAHAERAEVRRLRGPALAYMAMPVAQALLTQAPVLIVGGALGPRAVVVFATSRTVARLGTAAVNMVNNSVVSEYSALAGAGDRAGFVRLSRAQAGITAAMTIGHSLAALAAAPLLLRLMTHDAVAVVQPFFILLVIGVAAEMVWSAMFTPIAAVNRHRGVTLGFVAVAVAGVALCHALVNQIGLSGAAAALAATHAAMVAICLAAGRSQHGG